MEDCDVQFCWWETVSSCFSMSGTITQKEKMNPCINYLSASFNSPLACWSGFSDLGQIKNQWLFPQRSTPLPSPCKDTMALDLSRFEHEEIESDNILWSPTVLCTGDLLRVCKLRFLF